MKIYNSLTQDLEDFKPLNPGKVTIYVCGITPYDTTHLGHAFTYISFDVLIRYLNHKKLDVLYTQNVTDINDRDNDILKRAKEQNISWQNLADFWTKKFLNDMQALNWIIPTNYLKASENIPAMIDLIQKLIDNSLGYVQNGSVYLDISKDEDYGKLSKLTKNEMLKLSQDFEEDLDNPDKRNPLDITLWRSTNPNQPIHIPSFDSPFGKGRPGWHIECSAMSTLTLGEQIDIHGGGKDLIFPHHEAEIAQSEGATNKVPFVKYWMHSGTVFYQGEKMSKSKGNLVMVSKLLEKYSANAIRFELLSHHWMQKWEFSEENLQKSQGKIDYIESKIKDITLDNTTDVPLQDFDTAMENNLDTPKALEILYSLSQKEDQRSKLSAAKIYQILGFI